MRAIIEMALYLIIPLICMYYLLNFLVPITFWQRLIGGIATLLVGMIIFIAECILLVRG